MVRLFSVRAIAADWANQIRAANQIYIPIRWSMPRLSTVRAGSAGLLLLGALLAGGCGLLTEEGDPQDPSADGENSPPAASTDNAGTSDAADSQGSQDSFIDTDSSSNLLRASSDRAQVELPAGWQAFPRLNPTADIAAAREGADLYLIVLAESKSEIGPGFSLENVSAFYRRQFTEGLQNAGQVQSDTPAIATYPAVQFRVDGALDGTTITALHTTVEAGQYYYQIIAWTKATQYGDFVAELQRAIGGFQPLNQG
ncbi:MAG: hypothetical protein AAGF66_10355 [Cyanobacteria bacterium P01_H01_bin.119]